MSSVKDKDNADSIMKIDRLVNLSDAVIAIAVTILILPLVDKAADLQVSSFSELVDQIGQQFLIFLISFVVICGFWLIHHKLFRTLQTFNTTIFWLNALWLLSIVVIPFPTELLGKGSNDAAFFTALYVINLLITAVAGLLIELEIRKSPQLQKPGSQPPQIQSGIISIISIVIVLLVVLLVPSIGPWALLLLAVINPISKLLQRAK